MPSILSCQQFSIIISIAEIEYGVRALKERKIARTNLREVRPLHSFDKFGAFFCSKIFFSIKKYRRTMRHEVSAKQMDLRQIQAMILHLEHQNINDERTPIVRDV